MLNRERRSRSADAQVLQAFGDLRRRLNLEALRTAAGQERKFMTKVVRKIEIFVRVDARSSHEGFHDPLTGRGGGSPYGFTRYWRRDLVNGDPLLSSQ